MKAVLTLALLTLACTCPDSVVDAQTDYAKLPKDVSSVAFIKGATGFLIDSIAISTGLDTVPYGFAFTGDTLVLDVTIFRPVDELKLQAFAGSHSFGSRKCWVDAPSADVHLSVAAGVLQIDSVGLSPMHRWYLTELNKVRLAPNIDYAKNLLMEAALNSSQMLMAAAFLEIYSDLPNLTLFDAKVFNTAVQTVPKSIRRHPRFAPLEAKLKVMKDWNMGRLRNYELMDVTGHVSEIRYMGTGYWVLNIYDATTTKAREDHLLLRRAIESDTLFKGIPVISVGGKASEEAWLSYQRANNFPWQHYREMPMEKAGLQEKASLFPGATYLLLDKKGRIEGVYDNVYSLGAAVAHRRRTSKP